MRLSLLLLLFSLRCFAFQITGTVSSNTDNLPFASVSILHSSNGVFCDSRGRFQMELEPGKHTLITSYTGYKNDTLRLTLSEDLHLNITLEKEAYNLNQVEINTDQEDPAYEMMSKISLYRDSFNYDPNYTCQTYVKSTIEEPAYYSRAKQTLNFHESIGELTKSKSHFFENIISKNDFSAKENRRNLPSLNAPSSYQLASYANLNPDIYFKNHPESQINWHKDFIQLTRLNNNAFVSPFSKNGNNYYNYKYLESYYNENNDEIAIIQVQGEKGKNRCFSGKVYINNSQHFILKVALEASPVDISYFKRFLIQYEYEKSNRNIAPSSIDYQYGFNDLDGEKTGSTIIRYTGFEYNPTDSIPTSKNLIFINQQNKISIAQWDSIRPQKLNETEQTFVLEQSNKLTYQKSNRYIDSLNATLRKPSFHNLFLQGLTWRNETKQKEFYLKPVLKTIQLISFGGVRINSGGHFEKSYTKANSLKLSANASYGLKLKNWKGKIKTSYTYSPKNFGKINLSIGDNFDYLSFNQSFSSVLSGSNFIDRQHLSLGHELELFNGFYWEIEGEYQNVKPLSGTGAGEWRDNIFPDNQAYDFKEYQQLNLKNQWIIRFAQKYYLEENRKVIVGSQYPELRILLRKSIPYQDFTSSFLYSEIQVSHSQNWRKIGNTNYSLESGHFFNKNGVQLNNLKFFRGGDDWLFSNAINTFQLIDRSGFQSQSTYMEGHLIHHLNGYFLNNIPIFKKLKISTFGGLNYLWVDQEINHHTEIYFGLEKSYSVAKQRYRISLSYHEVVNQQFQHRNFFKVGIDWYNFLTNKWIN